MSKIDEAYCAYVNWCLHIGVEPLNPLQYEKAVDKITPPGINNVDIIMLTNRKKKDKP